MEPKTIIRKVFDALIWEWERRETREGHLGLRDAHAFLNSRCGIDWFDVLQAYMRENPGENMECKPRENGDLPKFVPFESKMFIDQSINGR